MLWKKEFETGIDVIDKQHMHLVELVDKSKNLLHDAENGEDCYDQIIGVLKELADYTVYHFAFEEEKMEEIDYENIIAHRMEHKIFIKKVSGFMSSSQEDIDNNQTEHLEEMTIFLLEWLVKHILETDFKYIDEMKKIM